MSSVGLTEWVNTAGTALRASLMFLARSSKKHLDICLIKADSDFYFPRFILFCHKACSISFLSPLLYNLIKMSLGSPRPDFTFIS